MSTEFWFLRIVHEDGSFVDSRSDRMTPDDQERLKNILGGVLGGERGYLDLDLEGGGFAVVPLRSIRRVEIHPAARSGPTTS